jgi:hypothetical protein
LSTPGASSVIADRLRRCRRSARRACTLAVAVAPTGAAAGFLLPPGPVAELAMVAVLATLAGLSARGAYWLGQVHVLEELHRDAARARR